MAGALGSHRLGAPHSGHPFSCQFASYVEQQFAIPLLSLAQRSTELVQQTCVFPFAAPQLVRSFNRRHRQRFGFERFDSPQPCSFVPGPGYPQSGIFVAQSQGKTLLYPTDRQPSISASKQTVCLTSEPAHGFLTQPKNPRGPSIDIVVASAQSGITCS
jgi:hypothetical protein